MSLEQRYIVPPLRVWLWALVILGVILSLAYFEQVGMSNEQRDFIARQQVKIAKFAEHQRDRAERDHVVVALGTSMLRNATYEQAMMEKIWQRHSAGRLYWLRLTTTGGTIWDLLPLLDEINELRPNAILIQSTLLLNRHDPSVISERSFSPWVLAQQLKRKLRRALIPRVDPYDEGIFCNVYTYDHMLRTQNDRLQMGFSSDGLYAVLLGRADVNTQVFVFNVPRKQEANKLFSEFYHKMQQDVVAGSVELMDLSQGFSDEEFCDYLHLGARGREHFSKELVQKLAEVLQ